jgi:Fe-S cluster assembly ATP-binding protein
LALLELKNLHVALEDGTEIVKGVDLSVSPGEVHAVMGPNGSGKSTLAYALMGHPAYEITEGQLIFDGEDLTEAGADERAQKGLFLAFQYPHAIPGVTVTSFLRSAINAIRKARNGGTDNPIPVKEFRTELLAAMDRLKVPRELASRYLNEGFSGGEKKRVEILQMAMLEPRIAVLDGLRARHRRSEDRRGWREGPHRPEHGRAPDHPLPANPQLHQARLRTRLRRRTYR